MKQSPRRTKRQLAGPTAGRRTSSSRPPVDADPDKHPWVLIRGLDGWAEHEFEVLTELVDGFPRLVGLRIEPLAGVPADQAVIGSRKVATVPVGELARRGALWLAHDAGKDYYRWNRELQRDSPPDAHWPAPPQRPTGGSREFSLYVARTFMMARAEGRSGETEIMRRCGVKRAQASSYLEDARPHTDECVTRGPHKCRRHQGVLERPAPRKRKTEDGT